MLSAEGDDTLYNGDHVTGQHLADVAAIAEAWSSRWKSTANEPGCPCVVMNYACRHHPAQSNSLALIDFTYPVRVQRPHECVIESQRNLVVERMDPLDPSFPTHYGLQRTHSSCCTALHWSCHIYLWDKRINQDKETSTVTVCYVVWDHEDCDKEKGMEVRECKARGSVDEAWKSVPPGNVRHTRRNKLRECDQDEGRGGVENREVRRDRRKEQCTRIYKKDVRQESES